MERIETRVDHSFRIDSTDPCQLFGCSFHSYSFIIDTHGNLFSFDFENLISLPVESITQIAVSCEKENGCEYYFLTKSGSVYLWTVNNRPAKKLKLEGSKSNYELQKIRDKVYYIASAVPNGIYLFSEQQCEIYQQGTFHITELGGISSKAACHCFFQYLDPSFGEFFSIKDKGFIYGTTSGEIFFRDTSNASCAQDARLIVLEDNEKVMHVELAHIEELCYLLAIGHLGTIMIYYKHFGEGAMNFRQFNIQFPVNLVDKIQELNYAISINVGKVSFLKFKLDQGNIILESKPFQHLTQISNLRVLDQSTLEVLTKAFEYQKIKYDLQTISAENDPQIIRTLIKDALEELAISETALKQIEEEEEDLSRKLASVNQTLYAIQSINSKRKKGIPNSLEDTGFEFTLCPVVKSTSLANICLQPTTYLRACIKTTKFLQLESWYLALDLFSENNITGETKTLPVVGFESHYEQGLERYSVWERDVSIEPFQLPLKVTCALVMNSLNEPLRFPVAEMMVDDIHFAMPCNTDLIQSIQRRGLDDVSRELNESYTRQILLDKTGSYPFARFLRKQNSSQQITKRSFYNNKHVHIRCLIDPSMTDEQYRSILPNLLNEGRTVDEVKLIMNNAEQAYLTLASFPSSPIILLLSKAVNELDITIQSAHPSALFKTEANLILRLSRCIKDENQSMNLSKKLKFLEDSVVELQEIYQQDNMEIDNDDNHLTNSIKQIIERLYNTYDELPIGFVKFA